MNIDKEMENMLKQLNDSFNPILNNIQDKMDLLADYAQIDKKQGSFPDLKIEDLK